MPYQIRYTGGEITASLTDNNGKWADNVNVPKSFA